MSLEPRAVLVCLDLQRYRGTDIGPRVDGARRILAQARAERWPVLHVHAGRMAGDIRPLPGFEPRPTEPVFVRRGPSAFSNPGFAQAACGLGGPLALIGYGLQDTALATAFAAADRGLGVEVVCDGLIAGEAPTAFALPALLRPLESLGQNVRVITSRDLFPLEAGRLAAANAP